jgi:hypothetical protein
LDFLIKAFELNYLKTKKDKFLSLSFTNLVLRAGLEPARISPHAPQTCAATNYATSAKFNFQNKTKNYFFVLVSFFAVLAVVADLFVVVAVFATLFTAVFVAVLAALFAGVVEFKSEIGGTVTGELVFGLIFDGAFASTFEFVEVAGAVSVVSGLLERTDTPPFNAGIASISADSMKTVAAIIVVFDKTVAVPRVPKALLEMLLVNNAPASVFPG